MDNVGPKGPAKPIAQHATILYDGDTGRIKHIHQTVVLTGGKIPSESEMEQAAREVASQRIRCEHLKALHIEAHHLRPNVKYSVDPHRRTLIVISNKEADR